MFDWPFGAVTVGFQTQWKKQTQGQDPATKNLVG